MMLEAMCRTDRSRNVRTFRGVRATSIVAGLLLTAALVAACASEAPTPVAKPTPVAVVRDDHGTPQGLHNFIVWTPKVTTGAQPEGDIAFQNLAALGITTVLTVDGARPDVEGAAKHGLRYIHVPIGYDGVPPAQRDLIVKAVASVDGPVYVHCHHGMHRGPAAAAVACVGDEGMTPDQALAFMKKAGTDPKYEGLYRAAREAKAFTPAAAKALPGELVSTLAPDGMVEAMVDVDQRFEFLKASRKNNWGPVPNEPDVSAPHEARMLWEHYREIARLPEAASRGERFLKLVGDADASAVALEAALRAGDRDGAEKHFDATAKMCKTCHASYRDNK